MDKVRHIKSLVMVRLGRSMTGRELRSGVGSTVPHTLPSLTSFHPYCPSLKNMGLLCSAELSHINIIPAELDCVQECVYLIQRESNMSVVHKILSPVYVATCMNACVLYVRVHVCDAIRVLAF